MPAFCVTVLRTGWIWLPKREAIAPLGTGQRSFPRLCSNVEIKTASASVGSAGNGAEAFNRSRSRASVSWRWRFSSASFSFLIRSFSIRSAISRSISCAASVFRVSPLCYVFLSLRIFTRTCCRSENFLLNVPSSRVFSAKTFRSAASFF